MARIPGPTRSPRRHRLVVLCALASMLAGLLAPAALFPSPAAALPGDIFTVAGGTGSSSALAIGVYPERVIAAGSDILVSDSGGHVVRRLVPGSSTQQVVAGNGAWGVGANNVPAVTSELNQVTDMAVDTSGNIYFADTNNSRVRRVATNGTVTTFAGTGQFASFGDGGQAAQAALKRPTGLAFDAAGNLYIADAADHKVRRVATNGVISTYAGNGTAGSTGDGGLRTLATLNGPQDVEVTAAGVVLIADTGNHRVRQVVGSTISTYAGNGTAGLSGDGGSPTAAALNAPTAIASLGTTVYIADTDNDRVRRVQAGLISTVAGGGSGGEGIPATSALLSRPTGVAVSSTGELFISSWRRVQKVALDWTISRAMGNGSHAHSGDGGQATSAQLAAPSGLAVGLSREIYVADMFNDRIRRRTTIGQISTVAGGGNSSANGVSALQASLSLPSDVDVDGEGNLYIADMGNNKVRKVTNGTISTIAGTGSAGFSGDGGWATNAMVNQPRSIAVDPSGAVYVADTGNHRVRRIEPDGSITTIAGNGMAGYSGDGGHASAAVLNRPSAVELDGVGGLLIADRDNHRVRRIAPNGTITTIAGSGAGGFSGDGGQAIAAGVPLPASIAVDEIGTVFVGSQNRVRRIALNGTIATVAGTGTGGFSGDGGQAVAARMHSPGGLAVEPGGHLLLADGGSNRVRRIIEAGSPGGRFQPLTPARLLDSRDGTGGFNTPWGPGTTRDVQVAGVGGVPASGATAVVLNVTVTGGSSASHLTAWPTGHPRPKASNLNWPAGDTRPNLVTVKVGTGGKVSMFNNTGNVHVIADVVGWYDTGAAPTGSRFNALTPARLLDSRDGTGGFNSPWGPSAARELQVAGSGGVPATASAVVLNVTVTGGTAASHLTVWPTGVAKPTASNLNWPAGATRPNLVVVKLGAGGKVSLFNNSGSVHVVADVVGYFGDAGDRFHATAPLRRLDSRDGTGGFNTPWGAGTTRSIKVAGIGKVPDNAKAVVLNVTVTGGTAASHLTVWPAGVAKPTASNLNWAAGQTVPNLVVVKVGTGGSVSIFNNSGTAHVIADVVGWYG